MRRIDYHMHTRFSPDSSADPHEHVKRAIELGLDEICFTDHYDVDYPGMAYVLDIPAYYDYMSNLKEQYKDKITIKVGIEMGVDPIHKERIDQLLSQAPFDFVIGSIHAIGDTEFIEDAAFFDGLSKEEAHRRYFEQAIECVKTFDNINIFGHYDYIERYGPYGDNSVDHSLYLDLIDEFLDIIIAKGIGLEVNTSGFRMPGRNEGFPKRYVLERYYQKGGRIVTIGTDSHESGRVGAHVDDVIRMLEDIGFADVTTFTGQKRDR